MSTPPTGGTTSNLTVPNAVSLLRLLLVPFFWWLLLGPDQIGAAAWLVGLIATTDWIDGYLARRLGQVSPLGVFLDPLADRIMIASAVVGGLIVGVLPPVIGYPLIFREVIVGVGALWLSSRVGGQLSVRPLGKTSTFLLYAAVPAFYLGNDGFLPWLWLPIAWFAGSVGLIAYYWVGVQYWGDIRTTLAANASNLKAENTEAS